MELTLKDCLRFKKNSDGTSTLQIMLFVETGEYEKRGFIDKLLGIPPKPKYREVWFDVKVVSE